MSIKLQLVELGLDEKEAEVYELLLTYGASSISQILKLTKIKKGDLYNILYRLIDKNLIEKKNNLFLTYNPEALANLLQKEKETVINRENIVAALLPKLNNIYENSSGEILYKKYDELSEIKEKFLKVLQSNKRKSFFFSDIDFFEEYFYKNISKLNRSKVEIIFALEIKKTEIEKFLKFIKKIKNISKNVKVSFISKNDYAFAENLFILDKEVFLLKKKKNVFAAELINRDFVELYFKNFNFVSKHSYSLLELEEIIGASQHFIILKEDDIFSLRFLRKNKKLLSENLAKKLIC